jgi:hypothetical protein
MSAIRSRELLTVGRGDARLKPKEPERGARAEPTGQQPAGGRNGVWTGGRHSNCAQR